MHKGGGGDRVTDSMRMFLMGVEGGKPAAGHRRAARMVLQG